jgi:hypothetical protein
VDASPYAVAARIPVSRSIVCGIDTQPNYSVLVPSKDQGDIALVPGMQGFGMSVLGAVPLSMQVGQSDCPIASPTLYRGMAAPFESSCCATLKRHAGIIRERHVSRRGFDIETPAQNSSVSISACEAEL